ncbi:zinc-ribbon domain-containing protein [Thermogymnomonas acidicola]|uniref:zinc-ribbon domain-containing protein n=1 Tax=Thermogymnomonas acidicola TaxID=399579 RepID=UPI0016664B0F|nr:zinc-ribbon domain-containing protein [Thermogymnomonas acidicola]
MVDSKVPVLSQKYVPGILIFLLDHGTVHKTDLTAVTHSNTLIDKLINELKNEDLISVKKEFVGRNTYYISLTEKGKAIAQQLKKAQEIAESKMEDQEGLGNPPRIEVTEEAADRVKELRLLYHVNVYDDHVSIEEIPRNGGRPRIFDVYIKRNGLGDFRLWCEQDDSFDCVHVEVAWTYPEVQHMILHYKGKTKVCLVCGYENPENAKFCMECGARLE